MNPVTPKTFVILVIVIAAPAVWFFVRPSSHSVVYFPETKPLSHESSKLPPRSPVGQAGCLAMACHGGPAADELAGKSDRDFWRCSGSFWLACDPHAGAYSLLTESPRRPVLATARQIMARLSLKGPATEDARCLACHVNPSLAKTDPVVDERRRALRSEGVSCEACHGNAGDWLYEHTRWTDSERSAGYSSTGMLPLNNIGERAVVCMGCHVGAPADGTNPVRDMNHDMIAAGHPLLNFEYAEYLRRLPHHWREKEQTIDGDHARGQGFAARLWLVGRVAHAEVACKLLEDRIRRSNTDDRTPWPEFAEFNCAACHHTIQDPNRSAADSPGHPPKASLRWQSLWPLTYNNGLKAHDGTNAQAAVDELLKDIEKHRPLLERDISRLASKASSELIKLRSSLVSLPDREIMMLSRGTFRNVDPAYLDQDELVQMLNGLAALQRTRAGPPDKAFITASDLLRQKNWQASRDELKKLLRVVDLTQFGNPP
jgi:hypothetical protein